MAYEDYGYDPMGNVTGYVDQEAEAIALREEEEKKRKEAEERARKENERLAKERDNLAVHKQEVTTYANGSKTITNVAEVPATANAPGRPTGPVAPQGFQGQTDEFGGVDEAVERQRQMNQRQPEQRQQPRAPVVPVAPGNIFDRQIQAESGGRHIDPRTGQIMTSPKGALGIAQIMPATARQPGYGIAPITDEELRTPEGNRAFGERYKQGMLTAFNGDEEKATAAYNAGPGAVQKAVRRAEQQGGDYKDYLPRETQNYLQKVFGGQAQQQQQQLRPQTRSLAPVAPGQGEFRDPNPNAVIAPGTGTNPVATVDITGGAPTAPISPDAVAQEQAPIPTAGGIGIRMPGQPSGVSSSASAIDAYQQNQDNIPELMKLGVSDDPNVPTYIKERARNRAADLVQQERQMEKAKQQVANMTPTETAKVLRKKTEEGSAVKMFIYNMLGMNLNAAEEADKLGLGRETAVMGADGKAYLIKVGYNGKPLEGYNPETGKELTKDELIKVAAGATDMKNTKAHMMADAKGSPVTKTIDGKLVNGIQIYDPVRKSFYVQYGNKRDESPEGWTSASQNVEQQAVLEKQKAQIDLYKKFEGASIDAKFKYIEDTNKALVAKFGTGAVLLTPEEFGLSRPSAGGKVAAVEPTPMPAGTTGATQAPAGGPVPPTSLPAATVAQTQATQASSVPATTPGGQQPPTLSAMNEEEARKKNERELGQKSSEGVLKHVNENIVPASMAAADGSESVKRQFNIINDPTSNALFGLYNKAQSNSTSDKNWAIIRDWLGGKLDPNDQTKISQAIAAVKLDSNEASAAALWQQETTRQANAMIKSGVFGTGASISTSDRESAERAQLDINTTPALAVFAGKSQQLFGFDMARAKMDWAADKKFDSVAQMEKEWTRQQSKLIGQYGKVADERNAFIKANSDGKPATIGLVRKAYQMYPVPQYDPNLNGGNGGWKNMRDRNLNDILKGNR